MAAPRPSFSTEPNLRRLGVGGGGERPLRAQLVIGLVLALVLVAAPLYLWRRPSAHGTTAEPGASARIEPAKHPATQLVRSKIDAGASRKKAERVRLAPPQRLKCGASSRRSSDVCDKLPALEAALAQAIRESVNCAPKTGKEGTINYVLDVDFLKRRLRLFPGASGSWKGPQARRAASCVKRSIPPPSWESIVHQEAFYTIAILATYPAPRVEGLPEFE